MIESVFDTNVLVAAFRSNLGASYQLLQTLDQRTWRPVISPALALEYEAVLKRHALRDPNDDRILEVAVRKRAPVVTYNIKDFAGADRFGIRVMSPKEFLTRIGGRK
jgi:predicted nucleic acid-binding protein